MEKETILIRKIKNGEIFEKEDEVAVEYDLTIPLKNGESISVTCTPTYVEEMILARRFLAGELSAEEVSENHMQTARENALAFVPVEELFAIARDCFENPGELFTTTGCAHSCALVYQGKAVCCIEDIGRHNALDKVIGYALKHQIPFSASYVFASGRISGDYLEKALDAGFPMAVSRAAITKAAVELAREKDVTLVGFIRKNTGNIYHEGAVKICNDMKECDE